MKVYWYIENSNSAFYSGKLTTINDRCCMYATELGAYRHAYSQLLGHEEYAEELTDDSSLEDYKRVINHYRFLGQRMEPASIIEVEVRE